MDPNTLARVVAHKSRYCHIPPVLAGLHWLSVSHRINFKIATINGFQGTAPPTAFVHGSNSSKIHTFTITSVLLFYNHICTVEENTNGHFRIFFIHCISCMEKAAHPCFQKAAQAPFFPLMPTLVSLHQPSELKVSCRSPNAFQPSTHSCILARVLLHTSACAKAALPTCLLTYLFTYLLLRKIKMGPLEQTSRLFQAVAPA